MQYVIGAVTGLAIGCLLGYLKNLIVWSRYVKKAENNEYENETAQVYGRALASFVANSVNLVIIYFLRKIVPVEWISYFLGGATGLVAVNIITAAARK